MRAWPGGVHEPPWAADGGEAGPRLCEEALLELGPRDPVVRGDVAGYGRQGTDPQWAASRHGDAVLAVHQGGQSKMASGLADDLVAEVPPQQRRQLASSQVTKKPHTASSSSRTTWRRMSRGRSSSSK